MSQALSHLTKNMAAKRSMDHLQPILSDLRGMPHLTVMLSIKAVNGVTILLIVMKMLVSVSQKNL